MMAVAYWMAHAPQSLYPVNNGGDAAILYCFVFLYMFAVGGGPWSLDTPGAPEALRNRDLMAGASPAIFISDTGDHHERSRRHRHRRLARPRI
jgi:hypothetical protein